MENKDRIILALDIDFPHQAHPLVPLLTGRCSFLKIGWRLFLAADLEYVSQMGVIHNIMLDLKIDDIPNTVQAAVTRMVEIRNPPKFITVRGDGDTLVAAAQGRGDNMDTTILWVPKLSSNESDTYDEYYFTKDLKAVMNRVPEGLGIVASGERIDWVRSVSKDIIVVTPGIRMPGSDKDDHKHGLEPRQALEKGSDYLVIGRPLLHAEDPLSAFDEIVESMN